MENHSFYAVDTLDRSNSLSGLCRQIVLEKICLLINYKTRVSAKHLVYSIYYTYIQNTYIGSTYTCTHARNIMHRSKLQRRVECLPESRSVAITVATIVLTVAFS